MVMAPTGNQDVFGIMSVDEDGNEGLLMLPKEEIALMKAIYGDNVVPVRHFPTRKDAEREIRRFFKKSPPHIRESARVVDRIEMEAFAERIGAGVKDVTVPKPN